MNRLAVGIIAGVSLFVTAMLGGAWALDGSSESSEVDLGSFAQSPESLYSLSAVAPHPFLIPKKLPSFARRDEPVLSGEVLLHADRNAPRESVWLSSYQLIDGAREAEARVYQTSRPEKGRCGDWTLALERRVNDVFVYVCGDLKGEFYTYWKSVEFTSNYDQVSWLK